MHRIYVYMDRIYIYMDLINRINGPYKPYIWTVQTVYTVYTYIWTSQPYNTVHHTKKEVILSSSTLLMLSVHEEVPACRPACLPTCLLACLPGESINSAVHFYFSGCPNQEV
jgi:hypothetical protein